MEYGLGEMQIIGDLLSIIGTGEMSWYNQGTWVTSLPWDSAWGLTSAKSKLSVRNAESKWV